jgi:hypothetical protein
MGAECHRALQFRAAHKLALAGGTRRRRDGAYRRRLRRLMPSACLPCVLFAAFAGRLPCFRIDQIQPPARKAGDTLIDIAGALGLVLVRSPALHAEACVRAAVDEWRHSVLLSGAKPAFLAQGQMPSTPSAAGRPSVGVVITGGAGFSASISSALANVM